METLYDVIWLAESQKWAWLIKLFSRIKVKLLTTTCAHTFASNWQLPLLNQWKGEYDCSKWFHDQSPRMWLSWIWTCHLWIYINNLDQVMWLADSWKWVWHLNLFSMTMVKHSCKFIKLQSKWKDITRTPKHKYKRCETDQQLGHTNSKTENNNYFVL